MDLQVLNFTKPEYLAMHCAFLKIYQPSFKVKILPAGEINKSIRGPLSHKADYLVPFLTDHQVLSRMFRDNHYSDLHMIKFTKEEREFFDKVKLAEISQKDSTFGTILFVKTETY